jgi:galactitol-specific phosphotransferase system IIC component
VPYSITTPLYRYTYSVVGAIYTLPLYRKAFIPLKVLTLNVIKMARKKTSITIDEDLWKEWTMFVVNKTGSARKLSDEIENALKEYMKKPHV